MLLAIVVVQAQFGVASYARTKKWHILRADEKMNSRKFARNDSAVVSCCPSIMLRERYRHYVVAVHGRWKGRVAPSCFFNEISRCGAELKIDRNRFLEVARLVIMNDAEWNKIFIKIIWKQFVMIRVHEFSYWKAT